MKNIKKTVYNLIYKQVCNQSYVEINEHVREQVWKQVRVHDRILIQVRDKVWGQLLLNEKP